MIAKLLLLLLLSTTFTLTSCGNDVKACSSSTNTCGNPAPDPVPEEKEPTPPDYFPETPPPTFIDKRWPNESLPRKIHVPRDKFLLYETLLLEVEDSYENAAKKDLIDFVPSDENFKYDTFQNAVNYLPPSHGISYLFFREDVNEFTDLSGANLALASRYTNGLNEIEQAHIGIDLYDIPLGNAAIKEILTHEVGHFLGFKHEEVFDSVMYPYLNPYDVSFEGLTTWDMDNVYDRYILDMVGAMYKDLEKIGARIQAQQLEEKAQELSEYYGLSNDRALEVAKLLTQMDKIKIKRSLTIREKDLVTKNLFGVNFITGKMAIEKLLQGETQEDLIEKAAKTNGISPEDVGKLLEEYLKLN